MTFGALELETRRKILFAKDWVTVRSIGNDIVFIGELKNDPDFDQKYELAQFLEKQITTRQPISLIVDLTKLKSFSLLIRIACARWLPFQKNLSFSKTAFIVKTFSPLSVAATTIKYFSGLKQSKVFGDTTTAIQWCRK
jgi:hypothetical protein